MSLGFEQAGFDVLAAADSDPVHLAVHERNFPHCYPVCGDVSAMTAETIHTAVRKGWALTKREGEWDGVIDCLFGGPSCQGFSDMGKQRSDDERNDLIFSFARLVRELKPSTFVIENVPGLLYANARGHLVRLQALLRDAGYRLAAELPVRLDASEFGVPQQRRRVFIIGVADGLPLPATPSPVVERVTVADALDDLPTIETIAELLTHDALRFTSEALDDLTSRASTYAASLRGPVGLEYPRQWDANTLTGCQRTIHSAAVVKRFAALAPGQADETSRTRRLDGAGFAPTLRAGTGRDHGSFTAPRPIHHRKPRVITVREAARLHSFPDWFAFNVAKWHALREIGNAVPPRLAAALARTIADALGATPPLPDQDLTLGPAELLLHSLGSAADYYGVDRADLPADVRRQ